MALTIGIVGLPNVGKSTVFNALVQARLAEVANYPFCTIQPNHAVVTMPDPRLDQVAAVVHPQKVIHATIEFVDIAGLVRGASKGEGLGNQFLGHIRDTTALVHVVRCFDDPNIAHVAGHIDPKEDIEIVRTELLLADLQQLDRKIERIDKQRKTDRKLQPLLDLALELKRHLESGAPARLFEDPHSEDFHALCDELRFLTAKPVIYAANVDEAGLADDNHYIEAVHALAAEEGAAVVKICAALEEEMAGMTEEDRHAFLEADGAVESGLEQIIHHGFKALKLISFFTTNPPKEARAWTIPEGTTAPKAAGVIHTDFERGFIRAEVVPWDVFVAHHGEAGAKALGLMRLEGKEYVVHDGDVIYFRFNV